MSSLQGPNMPMPQPNTFQSSSQGQFPVQNGPANSQPGMLNSFGNATGGAPALWDGPRGPPSGQTHGPDGFRLDAAVDFLEHSKRPAPSLPAGGSVNEAIGLVSPASTPRNSIVNPQGNLTVQAPLMNNPVRDDAQMVDSLFGPANSATAGSSLLTGLQGLSIHSKEASTGLWGTSNEPSDAGLKGLPSLGGLGPANPSLAATEQKTQSRFAWGESSGGV